MFFYVVLLMAEILHQLIGSLSHYFWGFLHPRWCRISAINSKNPLGSWLTERQRMSFRGVKNQAWLGSDFSMILSLKKGWLP